jgi:putative peptidoglycan lipid II flippase
VVNKFVRGGLKSTTDILFRRQANITTAAFVIMFLTLASRLLGLLRFRIWNGEFGSNSSDLAAFLAAFKIPDAVFQIVVLGALSTAFIPVVSSFLAKRDQKEAARIFSIVLNYALVATILLTVLVFIFAQPIAHFLTSGLPDSGINLTAQLIRVLMLAQFFLIASNFVTGTLNSYHRFVIPALAPVFYNLGIIAGSLFLTPILGIYGPVVGVLFGSLAHLVIQIPLLRRLGVQYQFSFALPTAVKEVGKLMGPRTFGMAVAQIDSLVDIALASIVTSTPAATNIIVFNLALALQAFPAGVFGYALGVASLPTLAKEYAQENLENFKTTLIASLHQILYLVIPTVVVMIVLRIPIVRLLYGAPNFDWEATKLTAYTLAAFSIGIVGQSAIQLLARGFYALHDTWTPVKISITTVAINVFFAILFISIFNNVVLLGLSSSIGGTFSALTLLYFLSKRVGGFDWHEVLVPVAKMLLAGFLAGVALYTPLKTLDSASYGQLWLQGSIIHTFFGPLAVDTSHTLGLFLVTFVSATLGLSVYFLVTYILEVREVVLITGFIKKIRRLGPLKSIDKVDRATVAEPVNTSGQ